MTENNVNFNDKKSSLQNIDFSEFTKEKVIEKYEEILIQREKQLLELSYELGILNEKVSKNENKVLNNKLLSKENQLKQELTDKEIMFIKLQNLEKENDLLHSRLKNGDIKKDSVFSSIINKFIVKSNVAEKTKTNNNTLNTQNSNYNNNKNFSLENELGKMNNGSEPKDSSFSSKSLEIIKQKKLSRISLGDGNVSKKLASENIEYDPVFK